MGIALMRVGVVLLAIGFGTVLGLGCGDITVCPAILHLKPTIPDTTTIKVGAATIAIAGATWGGCEDGPPPPDFVWKASDSSIVSVTALDSIHARIRGLRPGVAIVTPAYRSGRLAPPAVTVTVVP